MPGVGLISASLFCPTFAPTEEQKHGWNSATILGILAGAVVAFGVFSWREHRLIQPHIGVCLLRRRLCRQALTRTRL